MRKVFYVLCFLVLATSAVLAEDRNLSEPEFEFDFPKVSELQSFFAGYEKDLREEMTREFDKAKSESEIFNPWSLSASGKVTACPISIPASKGRAQVFE